MEFEELLVYGWLSPRDEQPVSLRDEQKERTRTYILESALTIVRRAGEEALTIKAVAAAAEVTERTVYRHFENRDVLLQSVWRRAEELAGPQAVPQTAVALIETPRDLFPRLDNERELMRAYLHRRALREGRRRRRKKDRQQILIECVREDLEYLDERSLRRRAAIADVVASPYAWLVMQESWGFTGRRAGEAAAEALEILLNRRLAY